MSYWYRFLLLCWIVGLTAILGTSGCSTEYYKAEADKEAFTFQGQTITPTVVITDSSGGIGGLLELTVSIEQVSLSTLIAEY